MPINTRNNIPTDILTASGNSGAFQGENPGTDIRMPGGAQGIFQVFYLMYFALNNPEMLNTNPAIGNHLSSLLGFDSLNEMSSWRHNAGGHFLTGLRSANWDKIDTGLVAQEYEKLSHLADTGNPLLELIGQHESGGNYNVAYGGRSVDFTNMSINEVMEWQRDYVNSGSPSSAAGKYQIINKTLKGLVNEMDLTGEEKFDAGMQDRMAVHLMERRGLSEYLSGEMSEEKFMLNLSKEWASLPKDASGWSYYAGDGLNKAGVGAPSVIAAIRVTGEQAKKGSLTKTFARAGEATEPLEKHAENPPEGGLKKEFKTAALGEVSPQTDEPVPVQDQLAATPAQPGLG